MPKRLYTAAERLAAHQIQNADGCWGWIGATTAGYGTLQRGRRGEGTVLAHRLAWELTNGTIPEGFCVLHHCDNPPCTRVEHLFLGTRIDNIADMDGKKRRRVGVGERQAWAKLTAERVRWIRAELRKGRSYAELSRELGVHRDTVRNVAEKVSWRHVT